MSYPRYLSITLAFIGFSILQSPHVGILCQQYNILDTESSREQLGDNSVVFDYFDKFNIALDVNSKSGKSKELALDVDNFLCAFVMFSKGAELQNTFYISGNVFRGEVNKLNPNFLKVMKLDFDKNLKNYFSQITIDDARKVEGLFVVNPKCYEMLASTFYATIVLEFAKLLRVKSCPNQTLTTLQFILSKNPNAIFYKRLNYNNFMVMDDGFMEQAQLMETPTHQKSFLVFTTDEKFVNIEQLVIDIF